MDFTGIFINKIAYPVIAKCFLKAGKRLKFTAYYRKIENNAKESNAGLQRKRLFDAVDYAVKNIPYYRNVASEREINYSAETIFEDIKKFPVLTKSIIRNKGDELTNTAAVKSFVVNTSGGSTGEPVKLLQDRGYVLQDAAEYSDELAGYRIGDKLTLLWGSEKDIFARTKSLPLRLFNRTIRRTQFLNSFRMSENDMYDYVNKINRFKPRTILAYVQSIYELSGFIKEKDLEIHSPHSIIVSAGTLFPDFRETIEEVFRCKVYNRYGSREVGCIAMECECHRGLHIHTLNQYIEVLSDDDAAVDAGKEGRIIITNLTNRVMPLIRFEIGDIGALSLEECDCSRTTPLLQSVLGRTVNVFKTRKGDKIDGEFFTHLFYGADFVRKFQFHQTEYERIEVLIESSADDLLEQEKDFFSDMTKKIRLVMGDECKVEYTVCDCIEPSPSGKFIYTISDLP